MHNIDTGSASLVKENNITNKLQRIKLFKWSVLAVLVFSVVAHGYRFANNMYSHDSLLVIYQNDYAWQVSLGRFIQPLLILLRGSLCSPWLISVIAILFTSLSVYFIADFLKINNKIGVVLTAGIFVCNTTVISANAAFLPWVDFYTLTCFLAVFGVWCIKMAWYNEVIDTKWKRILLTLVGIFALIGSLSIYQSYICVAIGLIMIDVLFSLMKKAEFKDVFKRTLIYIVSFVIAGVIYYVMWKLMQIIFHVGTADSYNGLSTVGDYSDTSIFSVLINTYKQVIHYFWTPEIFKSVIYKQMNIGIAWTWILRFVNVAMVVSIFINIFLQNKKEKTPLWQRICQLVILVLLPFGLNFVSFISKGMEHTLMVFAFLLVYVLAIQLFGERLDTCGTFYAQIDDTEKQHTGLSFANITKSSIVLIPFVVLLWNSIVYSNQVYLKKELQAEATTALMNRVVYEIEHTENYVSGETEVAFFGNFQVSDYVQDLADFEEVLPYGMGKSSVTYIGADYALLKYILDVNMNLTRVDTEDEAQMKQVEDMPCYPAEGSIAYIDDVLVVKIAEF